MCAYDVTFIVREHFCTFGSILVKTNGPWSCFRHLIFLHLASRLPLLESFYNRTIVHLKTTCACDSLLRWSVFTSRCQCQGESMHFHGGALSHCVYVGTTNRARDFSRAAIVLDSSRKAQRNTYEMGKTNYLRASQWTQGTCVAKFFSTRSSNSQYEVRWVYESFEIFSRGQILNLSLRSSRSRMVCLSRFFVLVFRLGCDTTKPIPHYHAESFTFERHLWPYCMCVSATELPTETKTRAGM